jgi:hypothetical protein
LQKHPDDIFISIEEEAPTAKQMADWEKLTKTVVYGFPLLTGAAFSEIAKEMAIEQGIDDPESVNILARACEGDTWMLFTELQKIAAGGTSQLAMPHVQVSMYDTIDRWIENRLNWMKDVEDPELRQELWQRALPSVRTGLRLRDGDEEGIPPFLVRKRSWYARVPGLEKSLAKLLRGLKLSRSGYADPEESLPLL